MPDGLNVPAITESIGELADYVELRALRTGDRVGIGDISSALQIIDDRGDLAEATESKISNDSTEHDSQIERLLSDLFFELERRQKAAGGHYPFDVIDAGRALMFRQQDQFTYGHVAYLYGLLASEAAFGKILPRDFFTAEDRKVIPDLMQILGTIAAAGFVGGSSMSFGHPRPKLSKFTAALKQLVEQKVREGKLSLHPKPGSARMAKDAGIDIVAWRHFPDGFPGKVLLFGQCATGKSDWERKGIRQYLNAFFNDFFVTRMPSRIIDAIFLPFSLSASRATVEGNSETESLDGVYRHHTDSLGVVVDRCRLAYLVPNGMALHAKGRQSVDAADRFSVVQEWVEECIIYLRDDSYLFEAA